MRRDDAYLLDILIQEYFRVDLATVWKTVRDDLPPLIELIEPLVPEEDEI